MSNVTVVTAREVREFFNADPKRLTHLSPEARATVEAREDGSMPAGRLHADAVARHNKVRKVQYVTGATKEANESARSAAKSLRERAADAGFTVGSRGPLPQAFLASL